MGEDLEGREERMEAEEEVARQRTVNEEVEEEEEGMGVEGVSVAQTRIVKDHGSEGRAG